MQAKPDRSVQDVFDDHLRLRQQGAFDTDLERNYAADVVMIDCKGVHRGHEGVRETHRQLERELPHAHYDYRTRVVDGEVCFLEWSANEDGARVDDGTDTLVIRDGRIVAQTIHYTVKRS